MSRSILVYDLPAGRIYCKASGRTIAPTYAANDYFQWNIKEKQYKCYRYGVDAPRYAEHPFIPGQFEIVPSHDHDGDTTNFEVALDWLLKVGRKGR